MRVAANLSMLFTDLELINRYERAALQGFKLVEVSLPYSHKAEILKEKAEKYGLQHVLINSPPGNWSAGQRGIAALTSFKDEFKKSVDEAIHYAKVLNCPRIHVMAGIPEVSDENASTTYLDNIKYAAERMEKENITCLIEPINSYTIPNYHLNCYNQALDIIKRVGLPNLKIMFDTFHAQQIRGQLTATMKDMKDYIGHVQVAQVPSRNEPDTPGEINFDYLFKELQKANPTWVVGCEYTQSANGTFDWVQKYGLEF